MTPRGGIILDPFTGTGTTLQAARAEGFQAIGVEQDPDAIKLIKARLDALPKTEASAEPPPVDEGPTDLFGFLDDPAA